MESYYKAKAAQPRKRGRGKSRRRPARPRSQPRNEPKTQTRSPGTEYRGRGFCLSLCTLGLRLEIGTGRGRVVEDAGLERIDESNFCSGRRNL